MQCMYLTDALVAQIQTTLQVKHENNWVPMLRPCFTIQTSSPGTEQSVLHLLDLLKSVEEFVW